MEKQHRTPTSSPQAPKAHCIDGACLSSPFIEPSPDQLDEISLYSPHQQCSTPRSPSGRKQGTGRPHHRDLQAARSTAASLILNPSNRLTPMPTACHDCCRTSKRAGIGRDIRKRERATFNPEICREGGQGRDRVADIYKFM